ncbi:unnamed protein product [Sphagnum jensenii]|uniref:Dynein axonemal assembly factor 5 TPR repeats domain-containing protein n=1 Tax=Sphagnum jensenii TaxID=128206 RepID=A0ABP0WAM2_9BRYO
MSELLDEHGYPQEEVTKEQVVSAYLQTVQRTLNRLSDPDLKTRRKALEMLLVCLLEDDGVGSIPPLDVLQAAWDDTILGLVLRCLSDTSEKCRELAVQLIQKVADCIPEVDVTVKQLVPVMADLMGT